MLLFVFLSIKINRNPYMVVLPRTLVCLKSGERVSWLAGWVSGLLKRWMEGYAGANLLHISLSDYTVLSIPPRPFFCVCELGQTKFCMRIRYSHCLEYFMEIDFPPSLVSCSTSFAI